MTAHSCTSVVVRISTTRVLVCVRDEQDARCWSRRGHTSGTDEMERGRPRPHLFTSMSRRAGCAMNEVHLLTRADSAPTSSLLLPSAAVPLPLPSYLHEPTAYPGSAPVSDARCDTSIQFPSGSRTNEMRAVLPSVSGARPSAPPRAMIPACSASTSHTCTVM
jgi:hypothetical protein